MAKYRKKPIVVEAFAWFKNGDHPQDGPQELEGHIVRYFRRPDVPGTSTCGTCGSTFHDHGWIDTLEGGHIVCVGDYIITGVNGEMYPCKPDIFVKTYEEVKE
jgi:hypothetical protein